MRFSRQPVRHAAPDHRVTTRASGVCSEDQHGQHFHEPLVEVTLNRDTAARLAESGRIPVELRREIDERLAGLEEKAPSGILRPERDA